MKRFFTALSVLALGLTGLQASAQEEYNTSEELAALRSEVNELRSSRDKQANEELVKKIWGRQKSWNIGFVNSNWDPEVAPKLKCNYGFSMDLRKTWYVTRPIANMLRIGIDVKWFDITYVNYKASGYGSTRGGSRGWDSWGDGYDPSDWGYDPDDYDFDIDDEVPNLGSHQIDLGMSIGVSATVAPFYNFGNQLQDLKAALYFHFTPTFSALLISEEDEDLQFNYAFVPYFNFGLDISWKALNFFVEGRWGSANYNMASASEDNFDYEEGIGSIFNDDKISVRNAGVRVGIGLRF